MIPISLCRAVLSATTAVVLSAGAAAAAPVPAPPGHLNLSNQDNGQSFTVHKGDEVTVRLIRHKTAGAEFTWSAPTAVNGAVLHRDSVKTLPWNTVAEFHALADGTTRLSSQLRCVALKPGFVCRYAALLWQVTVKTQ